MAIFDNPSIAFIHHPHRVFIPRPLSVSWKVSKAMELQKSSALSFRRTHHPRVDATTLSDFQDLVIFTFACFFLAVIISYRDDVFMTRDIRLYPPSLSSSPSSRSTYFQWWGRSIRSLGRGYLDRIQAEKEEGAVSDILSYNEIMHQHVYENIPNWRDIHGIHMENPYIVQTSCNTIVHALQLVMDMKPIAMDYQWENMRVILRDPILSHEFQQACYRLQSFVDEDGRAVIGFDWGSCAWRHCGALADAQEALSELYNGIGLFEPYECLFVLDVIERSMRDIISTFPDKDIISLPAYVPYKAVSATLDEMDLMAISLSDFSTSTNK